MPLPKVEPDRAPTVCILCGQPQNKGMYDGHEEEWIEFQHSAICRACQVSLYEEHSAKGGGA